MPHCRSGLLLLLLLLFFMLTLKQGPYHLADAWSRQNSGRTWSVPGWETFEKNQEAQPPCDSPSTEGVTWWSEDWAANTLDCYPRNPATYKAEQENGKKKKKTHSFIPVILIMHFFNGFGVGCKNGNSSKGRPGQAKYWHTCGIVLTCASPNPGTGPQVPPHKILDFLGPQDQDPDQIKPKPSLK